MKSKSCKSHHHRPLNDSCNLMSSSSCDPIKAPSSLVASTVHILKKVNSSSSCQGAKLHDPIRLSSVIRCTTKPMNHRTSTNVGCYPCEEFVSTTCVPNIVSTACRQTHCDKDSQQESYGISSDISTSSLTTSTQSYRQRRHRLHEYGFGTFGSSRLPWDEQSPIVPIDNMQRKYCDLNIGDDIMPNVTTSWLVESDPVVLYSHKPCVDFYTSMLEMIIGINTLVNLQDMVDMFCWFLLHNSPNHHDYIQEAFMDLLTQFWDC